MNQSNTVTVQILDKEYCINCPATERANLESAARYLDGKMREIRSSGKVIGADRVAVMAALNIAHELMSNPGKAAGSVDGAAIKRRIVAMQETVESALAADQENLF